MSPLRIMVLIPISISLLLQACGGSPCPQVSDEVGARFTSADDEGLAIIWESSRYDPNQQCVRTDAFIIEGVTGYQPAELGSFFEDRVHLPDKVRGAGIGPTGDGRIRMTVSLFDRADDESYSVTIELERTSVTAVIPMAD